GISRNFEDAAITDGPLLLTFLAETVVTKTNGNESVKVLPEYMLFLKRLADGRYEPVSGRIDPALAGREVNPPRPFVEIITNIYFDSRKEIGRKRRVDVGVIYGSLIGHEFPDVLLKDVEVVSLDQAKKSATLRIKKDDEPLLRRAIKACSFYLAPHGW